MKSILAFLIALWCGSEDGVEVEIQIRGDPRREKVNLVCHKPEVRIPVYRRGGESDNDALNE